MITTTRPTKIITSMNIGDSPKPRWEDFLKSKKHILSKRQNQNIKSTLSFVRAVSKEDVAVLRNMHEDIIDFFKKNNENDVVKVDFVDYIKNEDLKDIDEFFTN
jgi:hypothetical protein